MTDLDRREQQMQEAQRLLSRRLARIPIVGRLVAYWWWRTGRWPVTCPNLCGWHGRQRDYPKHFMLCPRRNEGPVGGAFLGEGMP